MVTWRDATYDGHPVYGKGTGRPELWWKALACMLVSHGLLAYEQRQMAGSGPEASKYGARFPIAVAYMSMRHQPQTVI